MTILSTTWKVFLDASNGSAIGSVLCLNPHDFVGEFNSSIGIVVDDFIDKANSYYNPIGRNPSEAWVLLQSQDVRKIQVHQESLGYARIQVKTSASDGESGSVTVNFSRMYLDRSLAIATTTSPTSSNVPYLCRFVDQRQAYSRSTLNQSYNVMMKSPVKATPGEPEFYFEDTLNSNVPWTWDTMLGSLWGNIPVSYASPSIPSFDSDNDPFNYIFNGANTWEVYNDILEEWGYAVGWNHELGLVEIINLSDVVTSQLHPLATGGQSGIIDRLRLAYPQAKVSSNATFSPENIRVYFPVFEPHGEERDTPRSSNYMFDSSTFIDIPTSISSALPGTVIAVWDSMPALRETTGDTFVNATELGLRATALGGNIAASIANSRQNGNEKRWAGLIDVQQGPGCTSVTFRDFGDGMITEASFSDRENPVVHRLIEHHERLKEACSNGTYPFKSTTAHRMREFYNTESSWPKFPQFVQVTANSSVSIGSEGDTTGLFERKPNSSDFITGIVTQHRAGAMVGSENVWILLPENVGQGVEGEGLVDGDTYYARLAGGAEHDGDFRPVYLVEDRCVQARWIRYRLLHAITTSDASAIAEVLQYHAGTDPDPFNTNVTVFNMATSGGMYGFHAADRDVGYAFLDTNRVDNDGAPIPKRYYMIGGLVPDDGSVGSGSICPSIPGVQAEDLQVVDASQLAHVIGYDSSGCLVKTTVNECETGSPSPSV